MAARVDVGGRGEELVRPDTENGVEAAGSGDSGGAGDEQLRGVQAAAMAGLLRERKGRWGLESGEDGEEWEEDGKVAGDLQQQQPRRRWVPRRALLPFLPIFPAL